KPDGQRTGNDLTIDIMKIQPAGISGNISQDRGNAMLKCPPANKSAHVQHGKENADQRKEKIEIIFILPGQPILQEISDKMSKSFQQGSRQTTQYAYHSSRNN